MKQPEFGWNKKKARTNLRKHDTTFDEAMQTLKVPSRIVDIDDRHDYGEVRLKAIGMAGDRVLAVVCVEIEKDFFRIVSARRAEVGEEVQDFENWSGGSRR